MADIIELENNIANDVETIIIDLTNDLDHNTEELNQLPVRLHAEFGRFVRAIKLNAFKEFPVADNPILHFSNGESLVPILWVDFLKEVPKQAPAHLSEMMSITYGVFRPHSETKTESPTTNWISQILSKDNCSGLVLRPEDYKDIDPSFKLTTQAIRASYKKYDGWVTSLSEFQINVPERLVSDWFTEKHAKMRFAKFNTVMGNLMQAYVI